MGAPLLQVDVFCRTGVLHKLLVELVKCTPGKWGIAGDQGLNPGSPKGLLGLRDSVGLCSGQSSPGEDSLVERAQQLTNREVPQTVGFSGPPSLFQDRVRVAPHRRKCQGCDRHAPWAGPYQHTHSPHRLCQGFGGVFRHKDMAGKPVISRVFGDEPKVPVGRQAPVRQNSYPPPMVAQA